MSKEEKEEGNFKMPEKKKKGRPKKLVSSEDTVKVELNKKEDTTQESEITKVVLSSSEESEEKEKEPNVQPQITEQEHSTEDTEKEIQNIIEITEEEPVKEELKTEPFVEDKIDLPENVDKLVSFMKETGGTVEDYVRLNADYSNIDETALLKEYYKHTKSHLNNEEINFVLEDSFSYDEEVDEERYVRKKKLAYKEEVAKAKNFLEDLKGKYYDEIKLRPGITQEQQKATDFFNRHNEEQKMVRQRHDRFKNNTNSFFNNDFKGFNFNVGDKKFRYNVSNTDSVANSQSDLTNFVGKFLNDKGEVKDFANYHKAIYAAENADTIANHFYEQGKADAVKNMMAKSKNISSEPRTSSTTGDVYINGLKVKAITGADSSKLRIKTIKK